jgi:hypothetical protein
MMPGLSTCLAVIAAGSLLQAAEVRFLDRALDDLVSAVPGILAAQDAKTGRFGTGIWIVTDQNVLLPLAAAWSRKSPRNPYYHSAKVLDAIMLGGDALIDDADQKGQWVFRKKDGSTWGKIYMPWTYSRWIRAYALIREAMPAERWTRWDAALRLGYQGISKELVSATLKNIPAHHAMGLYIAGQVFGKPEWMRQAAGHLHRVVAAQSPDGYWSENMGPVISYGFVYVEAVGTYAVASGDQSVIPALRRSAVFHSYFTYPDGTDVETVDERNPYYADGHLPNVGFTLTAEGRWLVDRQLRRWKGPIPADLAASFLLWGREGDIVGPGRGDSADFDYVLPSGAAIRRRGPWFLVISTMTTPVPNSRWIQDRQNFVSVFHDKAGLILGGGNTKMQPAWSNFTVGDTTLLTHRPGDENPNFQPPAGLRHVPTGARLLDGAFGVELTYGDHRGRWVLNVKSPQRLEIAISGDPAMTAHATLLPHLGQTLESAAGKRVVLAPEPVAWSAEAAGAWIGHGAAKVFLPEGATVRWPVLPHDPYKKDGRASADQGRIVVTFPAGGTRTLTIEVSQ